MYQEAILNHQPFKIKNCMSHIFISFARNLGMFSYNVQIDTFIFV